MKTGFDPALPLPRRIWWPWHEPAGQVAFRKAFRLESPLHAQLYLSASGPYSASLDGQPLDSPTALLPSWRSMHILPLDLTPGDHCLQVEAQPGNHNQPFLMACLDSETVRLAATGPDWDMARQSDDGGALSWQPAWAFDGPWAEPWGMPCNAPLDFCRLNTGQQVVEFQSLRRVAGLFGGLAAQGAAARLLPGGALAMRPAWPHAFRPPAIENTRPRLEWYRTREAHSLIYNTWLDLFEPRAPHVVLDVGQETFARLRLSVRSGGPVWLAITTGESLNEVQRYARRVTDIVELRDGESFTTAPTGFRFVKVMALSAGQTGGEVILEPVEAQHLRYPIKQRARFACSDPALDEVWQLSERTAHLCMQNEVWDGIKRDQLPWMGDLYTEALAIYALFGEYDLVRRTLEVLAEIGPAHPRPLREQLYPGLVAIWKSGGSSHPGADSGDINGIPSYTLWWIIGLVDYALYSGDDSLARAVAGELFETLEHVRAWVGPDGIWRFHGGWDFIDWSPVPQEERATFCHLLACQALHAGADLLEKAGRDATPFRQTYSRMLAATRARWPQGASFGQSHHANAMAIRSGVLDSAEATALFARTLASDPPYPMTYWHRYLDLEAAGRCGQVQWGLDYIRKHWGLSLQLNLTTLWEAFDPSWIGPDPHALSMVGAEFARYGGYETSLCHGWSAGPAAWLQQYVLGIRPLEAGYAVVDFQPNLGDLEWAEGEIPTPHGMITVSLKKDSLGKLQAHVSAPPTIQVRAD